MSEGQRRHRRPPAGSDPSVLATGARTGEAPLRLVQYDAHRFESRALLEVAACADILSRPGVTWIDLEGPGRVELAALQQLLGLHPLAVADAAHPPQRPHYSLYGNFELFVLAAADDGAGHEQVSLFLGDGWIVTIRERAGDPFEPVRQRLEGAVGPIRARDAAFLAAALIATLVEEFFEPLELFRESIEELEDAVLGGSRKPLFGSLHRLRRRLLGLRRAIGPMREAILRALRAESHRWNADAKLHLREAGEDAAQLLEMVETAQGSAASLGDLYLSVVGSRTNEVVTLLTLVSTLFLPMTFLAGVWGMNFRFMPELEWRYGYLFAWAVLLGSAAVQAILFARKGWFRSLRAPWGASEVGERGTLAARRRKRVRPRRAAARAR